MPRLSKFLPGLMTLVVMLGLASPAIAQTGQITGRVIDDQGQALGSVQISLDGTSLGALSNQEGRFLLLNVPNGIYTVTAQHIGFAARHRTNIRIEAGGTAIVDFTMPMQALAMEGLVVTGVVDPIEGVKVPFTIGRISTENMAVPTTQSALASISGKVAGASVVRGSGQPGAGVSIMLRTPTSVFRSNTPMFVVDGVILSSQLGGTTVDLESLDIESVEVVKGAAAASLYGSRAAAGVIQITTKRGRGLELDQTQVKFRSEFGMSGLPKEIELSNTHNYLQAANGTWIDLDGNPVPRTARVLDPDNFMDNPYTTGTYNNMDRFFEAGAFKINTLSVAKNSISTNFLASFTNYDEAGSLVNNSGFQRRSFRLNLDHRIGSDLTLSASTFHSRSHQDDLSGSPFTNFLYYEPDVDLGQTDADGNYVQVPDSTVAIENPIWRQGSRDNFNERTRTLVSSDIRWKPFTGFNLNANVSYDRGDRNDQVYVPKGTPSSSIGEGESLSSYDKYNRWTTTLNAFAAASYNRGFGPLIARTTVRAILERESREQAYAYATDLAVMGVPDLDIGLQQEVSGYLTNIRSTGYLAQLGLDWDGKYIADLLVRRDGGSLFGPDARWNNYYRAAGSYRMAQESWWPFDFMNEFKVRYAIGTAGGRPNFSDQFETWSVSADASGNVTVGKNTLGNRFLKPEFTTEQDMGVDIIFNHKYSLQLSYIRQRTEDLLISLPLPAVTGYSSQITNTGVQEGTTWEATFEAQIVSTPDVTWSMDFVADRSRSSIVEWNRSCYFDDLNKICEGAGMGEVWGESFYRSMDDLPEHLQGVRDEFQLNDEGYVVWVGQGNGWQDGVANGLWASSFTDEQGVSHDWGLPTIRRDENGVAEISLLGRSEPDMQFGWMNNLRWKNLGLHVHFQGQIGGNVYNGRRQRLYQHVRHGDLDQTGKEAENKKTIDYYQYLYNKNVTTAAFMEQGTYLKLRSLSATYVLGPGFLERLGLGGAGISQINVGLIGRNLLTFTGYTGFDPEAGSVMQRFEGINSYPKMRQLTGYMEITF